MCLQQMLFKTFNLYLCGMSKKVDPNLQMIVDILKTGDCIDSAVSKALKPFNLTHVQYNILRILRGVHPGPLYVGEVKNRLLFTNSDITRLLDRLIKKELVERKTCPENRRRIEVSITKAGLDLLEESTPHIQAALFNFLKDEIEGKDAEKVSARLKLIREKVTGKLES